MADDSRPAKQPEIDGLAQEARRLAEANNLVVVSRMLTDPGGSEPGWTVALDGDDIDLSGFCELAAAAGARLLYLRTELFDSAHDDLGVEDDILDDPKITAKVSTLRRKASAFDGRLPSLEAAFVIQGVVHFWAVEAAWYAKLFNEGERIAEEADEARGVGGWRALPPAEHKALVERVAGELLAIPEFRVAPSRAKRFTVAKALHPEVAEAYSDISSRKRSAMVDAVDNASSRAEVEGERAYAELEKRLPELAIELSEGPRFWKGSAQLRKERTKDFLAEKTGGYRPSSRIVELLLDEAKRILLEQSET